MATEYYCFEANTTFPTEKSHDENCSYHRFQPVVKSHESHEHSDPRQPPPPKEAVNHPAHYGGKDNPHEHVKCMEAVLKDSPMDPFVGGLFYNCTKYLWRLGKKGADVEQMGETFAEDAKKAKWYLDTLVEYVSR